MRDGVFNGRLKGRNPGRQLTGPQPGVVVVCGRSGSHQATRGGDVRAVSPALRGQSGAESLDVAEHVLRIDRWATAISGSRRCLTIPRVNTMGRRQQRDGRARRVKNSAAKPSQNGECNLKKDQ
jgi:hypothetical protein